MRRAFGLRAMLYLVVVMYGATCCLLYVVVEEYRKEQGTNYVSLRENNPKLREINPKVREITPELRGNKLKVHINSTKQQIITDIKPKQHQGLSNEPHPQQELKVDTGANTQETNTSGYHKLQSNTQRNTQLTTQFSLEGREFQTLVNASCPSGSLWPVIQLQPGIETQSKGNQERDCVRPRFSDIPLPRTALASFPGCGNTWSRHLIQQVTGIWTGSLYNDPDLRSGGFAGEGVANSSVVVTKTHWPYVKPNASAVERYPRTVLVIRSPQQCLLAEFHRRHSNQHTGLAPQEMFNSTKWNYFVSVQLRYWFWFYETWLKKDTCTLILDYQRLQSDLASELRQLVSFLGVEGDHVEDTIHCILTHSQGKFKRKGKKSMSVFSESQRKEVDYYGGRIAKMLKQKANYEPIFTW